MDEDWERSNSGREQSAIDREDFRIYFLGAGPPLVINSTIE